MAGKNLTIKTKPSTIIREQIAALNWAEKQKGVRIYMNVWCDEYNGKCEVCEAGAWYAKKYGFEKAKRLGPKDTV